jgi:hypothetical protein
LVYLRQYPPIDLRFGTIEQILGWAIEHWQTDPLLSIDRFVVK